MPTMESARILCALLDRPDWGVYLGFIFPGGECPEEILDRILDGPCMLGAGEVLPFEPGIYFWEGFLTATGTIGGSFRLATPEDIASFGLKIGSSA